MSASPQPFAVQAGQGEAMPTPNCDTIVVKADTRRTNGSMSVFELTVAPRSGPALHSHLRDDELWYVLEGGFRFQAGEEMLRASTGGLAFGPRGTPHCFQNTGDTPGRLLIVTTPSGLERFFTQSAALSPPLAPEVLAEVGGANWLEFVGPPVGVTDPL
jgi:mannose-6-phosphate isomerase-like protein (cupin superfamily)